MPKLKEQKFEDHLKRLEQIVDQLENKEAPLDQSLALFEEGVQLARGCQKDARAGQKTSRYPSQRNRRSKNLLRETRIMMPEPLHSYFQARRKMGGQALNHYMDTTNSNPEIIHEAMRYSVFAGGKRLRPVRFWREWRSAANGRTSVCHRRCHGADPYLFPGPR